MLAVIVISIAYETKHILVIWDPLKRVVSHKASEAPPQTDEMYG